MIKPGSWIRINVPSPKCPNVPFFVTVSSAAEQSTAKNRSGLNLLTEALEPRKPTSSWTFAPAINV